VPVLMSGPRVGTDRTIRFNEREAVTGGLGRRRSIELMPLALAAAGRLAKYGA
jgi:2,3-bisphosphoglycerate-independent phosphoglycerate mutase